MTVILKLVSTLPQESVTFTETGVFLQNWLTVSPLSLHMAHSILRVAWFEHNFFDDLYPRQFIARCTAPRIGRNGHICKWFQSRCIVPII